MKRIDCIDFSSGTEFSKYNVQGSFIKKLHEGLLEAGLDSRLHLSNLRFPGKMIDELIHDRPECTITFNGIPLNDQLESVSTELKIPNITFLIDAPFYFLHVMNQPYNIFTCFDRGGTELYRKLGFRRMMFLPHATHRQEPVDWNQKRPYDAVMLASVIDPDAERSKWKERFSPAYCSLMDAVAELMMNGSMLPTLFAFIETLEKSGSKFDLNRIPLNVILHSIETYVRGKDRIELIRSIRDVRIDLFGQSEGKGWSDLIKQDNVVVHDAVKFDEAIAIMRESKVVLNSCPTILDGAHERVFAGLMGGSVVLSSKSKYLSDQFPEGNGIYFYTPGRYETVNGVMNSIIADEDRRKREAAAGRRIVEEKHTWKERAKQILSEAGPLVDAMNRGEIKF